jgi:hypothetical protein
MAYIKYTSDGVENPMSNVQHNCDVNNKIIFLNIVTLVKSFEATFDHQHGCISNDKN